MTGPEVIDQAGGRLAPRWFVDHGGKVIAGYCGKQSWKVPPADYVRAVHAAGIGYAFFWEDNSTNALGGAAQGHEDGAQARQQMRALIAAVGYAPGNRLQINAAVDFDTDATQYPAIDGYLAAFDAEVHAEFDGGDYGEATLLDHEAAAGIMPDGYGTYAWSHGAVSRHAVMQQTKNGQVLDGTDVDFGQLIDPAHAGIWWPPGHPLNTPGTGGNPLSLTDAQAADLYADVQTIKGQVLDVHNWLAGGTGPGQRNEGGTIAADLAADQQAINELHLVEALIRGGQDPTQLANQLAPPLVAAIKTAGSGIDIPPAELVAAFIQALTQLATPTRAAATASASPPVALTPIAAALGHYVPDTPVTPAARVE